MANKGAIPKKVVKKTIVPKQNTSAHFQQFGKTRRSPPSKPQPKNQANESVYLCQVCLVEDGVEKVRCDGCMLWYHFACIKLNKDVLKEEVWKCLRCANQRKNDPITSEVENPTGYSSSNPQQDQVLENPQDVGHKSTGSRKSKSNASTVSRRAALALQKLEEERLLLERRDREAAEKQRERDREYLNQKYSILEDDEMSELSFDDQEIEQQKLESIREWAANIPDANDQAREEASNDNIHLRAPQLNSTAVKQQPSMESTAPNQMAGNAVTTVRSVVGEGDENPLQLPTWLTHPNSETMSYPPTLARAFQENQARPPPVQRNQQTNVENVVDTKQLPSDQLSTLVTPIDTMTIVHTSDAQARQMNTNTDTQQQLSVVFNQLKADVAQKASRTNYQVTSDHQSRQQGMQSTMVHPWSRDPPALKLMTPTVEAVKVSSKSYNLALNSNQQSTVVPMHQRDLRHIMNPPYSRDTNHIQNLMNLPNYRMVPSQTTSGTIGTPIAETIAFHQSINAKQAFGQCPNVSSQTVTTGKSYHSQAFHGKSQTCTINKPFSGPQSSIFANAFENNQQHVAYSLTGNQTTTSESQNSCANQQPLTSSQPQVLDYHQHQQQSWNNSQSYGASQPYITSQPYGASQPYITSQPYSTNQQYSTQQPFNIGNPTGSTDRTYSHQQSMTLGQSFTNSNQYGASSAAAGHLSMGTGNIIPVSQPFNMNNSMNASNGIMSQGAISTRLTAEQIAARHVMPKELPHFNGDPRRWQAFISAYDNANETCGFSNSENLGRLQKCLTGDAETLVKNRLFHKDSVPGVIETLRLIYGRPELIIETMLSDIQKIPAPKEDDLPALIKFAISVQNLSVSIQQLKAVEHLRNPTVINTIVDKLPSTHRLNWAFYKHSLGDVHIGHLGDWLYHVADVASRVVRVSSKPAKKQEPQNNGNKNKLDSMKPNPFLNTQVEKLPVKGTTNTKQSKSESKTSCPACNNNKCTKLASCKQFKDATRAERWAMVKKGNLCGRCFGNHKFYRCQSDQMCSIDGCKASHHSLLHNHDPKSESTSKSDNSPPDSKSKDSSEGEKKTCNAQRAELAQRTDKFRIVPVMLHHKNKSIRDYAYLDDGSNMTTMEDSLADELGLTGTSKELCVDWAFGQTHSTVDSRIVSVKVSGYFDNAPRFKMDNVRTIKHLHLPTQSMTNAWIDQYSHFKNVPIATYDSAKPRLLIGLQYSKLTVSLETIEGKEEEPVVCKTRLGWVVQGPTYEADNSSARQSFNLNMCVCQSNDNEIHQMVKDYFSMEHLGIKIPENNLESKELQRAKQILDSTTIKKNGRYETGLLWNSDEVELPGSYNMALKRLICLEAKMAKNPDLKANLCSQIKQFVEKGYIRKLSAHEIKNCKERVWYLPTFPVFNPKKPEKVRLVWDGAAKVGNTSLNSKLLVGPDQLVPLPELLRRFREREIAMTGDIAEMFHQIRVREKDQHAQRFLWREDPSKEPEIYVMMVMTFGSKCSPSSAQYVKNKNASEFKDDFPRAAEAIIENHYVDDMIDCTDTVDEAESLIKEVKFIHQAGGFNIRNFASNSEELLRRIGEKTMVQNKDMNIGNELGTERVLGMFWDTATDSFTYSLKFTKVSEKTLSGEHCPTKREVLRILMSVFDPLGLLANFLVYAKILLQEIWRSQVEWDEQIPAPIHGKWIQWIRALPNVERLQIPRWYSTKLSPNLTKSIQLHTFVDAGVEACAAVTYLRIEDDEGVDCCLIGSKTKVAPTKPMSVPRLELQAAVIGTRLAGNVKGSQKLKIDKQSFWSDSQTVMGWINSETRRYNQFVSFRVGEILESTEPNQWRWVPTKHNVADEATKSKIIPKLDSNSRWFKAPKFLYDDERSWFNEELNFTTDEELRPCFVMSMCEIQPQQRIELDRFAKWSRLVRAQAYVLRFVHNVKVKRHERRIGPLSQEELSRSENCLYRHTMREIQPQQLIELDRFSQWSRLVRAQAYVLRFVHNIKMNKQERRIGLLSQEELIQAENCLYRRAQQDVFLDEILILKHNEKVAFSERKEIEPSSELRTFSPYLDELNVLRQRGRIDAANSVSSDMKRPIILPRRHRVTTLLVEWYHRRYKHLNHNTALNEIRQRYIIPALRVVLKGVRKACQKCKNVRAKPIIPEMAALPSARLATFTRAFTFTGVDYFGPYYVKVNRSTVPRYGVLFTCMTTRAIHLEVAERLNTSSCINAVRRFSVQKGEAREFFSDNGTNFHGADNDLKKEFENLNQEAIQKEFTSTSQKWTFNPPTASHMGGAWERLIQTVKKCLKQMLTTKTPTHEMLVTLMAEVENIVNSRPLTYISLDSADDEALTPNHFLFGSSNALKPIAATTPQDLNRNDWKAIQEMTKHFWHRFVLEYLPDLTKRTKWLQQVEPIKVGDVVLVIDERNPRNTWPKGIVEEVIVAKDGCIRQVMVRLGKRTLPRPVSKLAILDVKPPNKTDEVKLNPTESVNGGKDVAQH